MKKYLSLILIVSFFVLMTGCCRGVIYHAQTQHVVDSTKTVQTLRATSLDSIYIYKHDSIIVKQKGDTVFIEKYKEKIQTRLRIDTITRTDTIFQIKIQKDSISVQTLRATSPSQKTKSTAWKFWVGLVLGIVVISAVYIVWNRIKKVANKIF